MSYWSRLGQAHADWPLQDDSATTGVIATVGPAATIQGGKTAAAMSAVGPRPWLAKALQFDGVSDYLSLATSLPTLSDWALEAWVRFDQAHDGTIIELRQDNSARLGVGSNGAVTGAVNDGTAWRQVATTDVVGAWVHAVASWDGAELRLFLNGTPAGAPIAVATQRTTFDDPDEIGRAGWGGIYMDGSLAGVRVHPALSAADVAELYNGPEPTVVSGPELVGDLRAGSTVGVSTGDWDSHSNGPVDVASILESSPDGLIGWQEVSGTANLTSYSVPLANEGAYLRVSARATNDGGDSERAYGPARLVEPPNKRYGPSAAGTSRSGAAAALARPTGTAVAAVVLTG